ncbi:hypothetical protein SUDANB51_04348 [Streptomyces sp. enrichment culture]
MKSFYEDLTSRYAGPNTVLTEPTYVGRLRWDEENSVSTQRMFIAPVVSTTVVGAIAGLGGVRRFGRPPARVPLPEDDPSVAKVEISR